MVDHAASGGQRGMDSDDRIDRLDHKIDQQGKWADEKLEQVRMSVETVQRTTDRTAVILDALSKDLTSWSTEFRGFGQRLFEIEGTLNGRHGQNGLVQQVSDLRDSAVKRKGAGSFVTLLWGALTGALVASAALWSLFPHAK